MYSNIACIFTTATLFVILYCGSSSNVVYAQPTPGVYFNKLGGAGSYNEVVNLLPGEWDGRSCEAQAACVKQPVNIQARPLAPFDEEMSLQLRGPLDLKKIGIYQRLPNGTFTLVSYWAAGRPSETYNIAFLGNNRDWTLCGGNALGYVNAFGSASSATPQILNGYLDAGVEITVMSSQPCIGAECGFYRGVGVHGWAGDKIFVVEATMPLVGGPHDMPAIWSLNAKIVRSAQYGCNCDRYGCGEFDIAEVLLPGATEAYSTLYSYNGAIGTPAYFPRPTTAPSTFITHYSVTDNRIYAMNLPKGCFEYIPHSSAYINTLHAVTVGIDNFPAFPNTNKKYPCW